MTTHSPVTGQLLVADTPHSLSDDSGARWPVIDGIPFLRVGRDDLVRETLRLLDSGNEVGALVELLRDADDWWDEPPPERAALRELVRDRDRISLREAMSALGFGRVGDYFAHRWSDPTYLAGLGLMEAHWNAPAHAFELACGIGHYLRALQGQGVGVTGVDVVFAKLWVARHFVVGPRARLLCADAAAPWPIAGSTFDLVLCQDAFYFLEPKPDILARLRAAVAPDGALLVGHIHNREAPNHSAGSAVTTAEIAALFPSGTVYEDAELTRAAAGGRRPEPRSLASLRGAEAFAVAEAPAARETVDLTASVRPPRRNPLYSESGDGWTIGWPSERYRAEYAPLATFPLEDASAGPTSDNIRRRVFVDLPERW